MKKLAPVLLLITALFISCNTQRSVNGEQGYRIVLDIQDAVIADVDTFFSAFSDSTLCVSKCYHELGQTLDSALADYKSITPEQCDPAVKEASLHVCLTVRDLYQDQFKQMVSLDSALNISFNTAQQKAFDSLSNDCFIRIEQAQDQLDLIICP